MILKQLSLATLIAANVVVIEKNRAPRIDTKIDPPPVRELRAYEYTNSQGRLVTMITNYSP